jgi:hypothetical protein
MYKIDDGDLAYNKKREAAERQASALSGDLSAKTAHKKLAALYGDRVIAARKAINLATSAAPGGGIMKIR